MNSNNPFEVHGIEHLSPSSIQTFLEDKPRWIMRYLFGYQNGGGPAMWRGTGTDEGVGAFFGLLEDKKTYTQQQSLELCKRIYRDRYESCKKYFKDQEIDQAKLEMEESRLERYLKTATEFYSTIGKPLSHQDKVELQLPDLPVPIIGYLDLLYEDTLRDIKTTARSPYKVSDAHARQVSVYAKATGRVPILDYIVVTAKEEKVVSYTVTEVDRHIKTIEQVAYSIMNFLSYSNDKYELANTCYPNIDDWKWDEHSIKFASTIWSI